MRETIPGVVCTRKPWASTVLVLLALAITDAAEAGINEWTSQGPNGGYVYALALDPSTPSTIYAGTASGGGGVYKSIDGGATWTGNHAGLPHTVVYTLAIDPSNPSTLYSGTLHGVYKSLDAGETWNGPIAPTTGRIATLAIDPTSPSTLYAGTAFGGTSGGIYKSTDGGETWTASGNGVTAPGVNSLVIDSTNPSILYAGTTGGVFKSTDGGGQWTAVNNGLASLFIDVLAIDPFDSATLYAGGAGVHKTTDGGATWTEVNNGLAIEDHGLPGVESLALDPSTPGKVYAGAIWGYGGVYQTVDGGASWQPVNVPWMGVDAGLDEPDVRALAIDPADPSILYAGTSDALECSYYSAGVYKTSDGGTSWAPANHGLSSTRILALTLDPSAPANLWAGIGGSGAAQSLDGGATWSQDAGDASVAALAIDPRTPSRRYWAFSECISLEPGGLIREDAGGSIDVSLSSPLPVRQLIIDPQVTANLYAVTGYSFNAAGGLYRSRDYGDNWTDLAGGGLPATGVTFLAIDESSPATLYAGTLEGVFKTVDGGETWTAAGSGLDGVLVSALAVDPEQPQVIYAGTLEGVLMSSNGGSSWFSTGLTETSITALAIDPQQSANIYAATSDGVFKSSDGGDSWSTFNTGLGRTPVRALVIDPEQPSILHAATNRGVFSITQTGPCHDGATTTCLNMDRFRVEVEWRSFDGTTGNGQVAPLGSEDSGLFWFFEEDNWEMLIKVLDGCAYNSHYWVFAAGTTTVEYTLRVTDTETGTTREYFNPLGNAADAVTDTGAFACTAESSQDQPASNASASTSSITSQAAPGDAPIIICVPSATRLCLSQGRFSIEVEWRDYADDTGAGQTVGAGNDTSDLFWFFSPANWEMLVKVLDACDVPPEGGERNTVGRFWLLAAATTDVEYTLRVTDTFSRISREYFNPLGNAASALIDTFETCP